MRVRTAGDWRRHGDAISRAGVTVRRGLNRRAKGRKCLTAAHPYSTPSTTSPRSILRTMAGPTGARGHGGHPIHVHPVRPLYRFFATGLGASMWFFLMYRAKKDGAALMGWKHPWDH
ncbi:NADH dehydrogenase (ubiquinone) 1 beta subcomplex subunit 2 [Lasiodiplodia hormozganensis]|uniref:NADH dehydrogenase (Ubiquinone) 1 beta subcomplex subunit 2 n=1 Tax=Lasiodiplodia hormozganensis TaxID=869390 RepID=A0AA40D6T3_9PEZI|nr:NADH dehydrogenase (ubiquinone) 1 beta subcomplex subunit 2 [Lasiodiplodia hormozganensis]